jgi:hypothetical protein
MSTVIPFSRAIPREHLGAIYLDEPENFQEVDEGLDEFLREGRIWFNGFGFGSVAGALVTVAAAYVWSWFL